MARRRKSAVVTRSSIERFSSERHNMFDVKRFTDGVKISSFKHDELRREENAPKFLNKTQQEMYKYQIIAEGECQWANRLRDGLFMGNALIVQEQQCVEYYGVTLKPWKHYIPVDYWFRNLTDAVMWAEDHPAAVQRMLASKLEFAKAQFVARASGRVRVQARARVHETLELQSHFTLGCEARVGDATARRRSVADAMARWHAPSCEVCSASSSSATA